MPNLDWDEINRSQEEYNKRREFAIATWGGVTPRKGTTSFFKSTRERLESKSDLDDIIDRQIRKIKENKNG